MINTIDTPWAPAPGRELSFGERAVALDCNPSKSPAVYACKAAYAHLIDQMNLLRNTSEDADVKRMAAVAITETQTAAMWAAGAIART